MIFSAFNLHPNQFYEWQKQLFSGATQAYVRQHTGTGYCRLSYMMFDEDVVYVSPGAIYQVAGEFT